MAKLLIGFDIEGSRFKEERDGFTSKSTKIFLEQIQKINEIYKVPLTLFILGETLLENLNIFKYEGPRNGIAV